MKKVLLPGVASVFLLSGLSCLPLPETPEARTLSALAPKVVFLCGFAIDFHPSPKLQASWDALNDPSLDTQNLIRLLKSPDPKIRSLAIFCSGPQVRPAPPAGNCAADVGSCAFVPMPPSVCRPSSARKAGDMAEGSEHSG